MDCSRWIMVLILGEGTGDRQNTQFVLLAAL